MQTPPDMKVRLSAELRRQVEAAAKANNRTLNSEIVSRLERSFMKDVASDARSKLAAERILQMDLTGQLGPMEEIKALKESVGDLLRRVSELEGRLKIKKTSPKTGSVLEAQKKLLRGKVTET